MTSSMTAKPMTFLMTVQPMTRSNDEFVHLKQNAPGIIPVLKLSILAPRGE
jgi:hypothetical protein